MLTANDLWLLLSSYIAFVAILFILLGTCYFDREVDRLVYQMFGYGFAFILFVDVVFALLYS